MSKELEIWKLARRALARDETAALLIVAESSGSSPGRPGFKMVVTGDEIRGSIGGGVMEVGLVEAAKQGLNAESRDLQPKIVKRVHRPNVPDASGMICSGSQTVIVCSLNASDLPTVRSICDALGESREIKLRITESGLATSGGNDSPRIEFWPPEAGTPNDGGSPRFAYEETLATKNKLFIVGGGHCALALSELMSKLDFRIALFDDRADLNTLEKNNFVHETTIIGSYERIDEFIESGDDHFVVVMTLGYKFDETVIRRLFEKNFRYFGVLGSRAKMKTLFNSLGKEGFDAARLASIRTPIGLPINSHSPEEIAVSIAAEIIAVKNG